MRILNRNFLMLLFIGIVFASCSGDSAEPENNPIIDEGETGGNTFKQEISMTILKDGVESDINIDQYVYADINVDNIEGYDIKKLQMDAENEDLYPLIEAEFPLKVGEYLLGSTYGEYNEYRDRFSLEFSEESYLDNTEYADLLEEEWVQPWLNVISVTTNTAGELELQADFGGSLIQYNEDNNTAKSLQIKSGKLKVKVPNNYPDIVDNSVNIANPPQVGSSGSGGGGGGGGGQNNVMANFEIRYPGTYISGTRMLYDTATLTFENTSLNAQYFEWEMIQPSTNFTESYFYNETQVASPMFSRKVKLENTNDSSRYYVKLTAYDENGNSDFVVKSVSLPMIKGELYINGDLIERSNMYYNENGEGYLNSLNSNWSSTGLKNEFWFATEGVFPSDGTFLTDFHQRGTYPFTDSDDEFFVKIDDKWTYDDPDGQVSSMSLDNLSIRAIRADLYKIIAHVTADFVLTDGKSPAESASIEIRYLAPRQLYYNVKEGEK